MYVTQTVLFTSVIPTYVYANSVVTKWDEIEETFIIFKTEGVSTIVEKSTVPYAMTTYTTVYETVFRPMDVTLTFYYQIYKTEVSYSTVTETKATEELFTLFETAYKRIQKTVTSFTPAIVLLNVVNPIMMGVTYTHLAVYEDCPHDEVMEYLGSNNLEIINQYDYSKHLVTEPLSIIITSERQSKHVSPRHISSIYEPNIDVHLESANKFEFTRLKNITKVPVDARISKTNITPRRTRFNTSYSKFISLPRDMISALSDKHRSLSTLDVKYNYRKEKDHEENGSIESEQRPRLYSSLENEIVSNF